MLIYNTCTNQQQVANRSIIKVTSVTRLSIWSNRRMTPEALSSSEFSGDRNSRNLQMKNPNDATILGSAEWPRCREFARI